MSAHTRGPWVANQEFANRWRIDEVPAAYYPVAAVYGHGDLSVTEANARLITAAPDLLQALSELLAMCQRQEDFNDDGDGGMYERAQAAIDKATTR